uniref:Uncharacterized protein n=1 Tax=Arundo donax TaxID=35708 RepID=A0A0A9HEH2_ARUDO
MTLPVTVAILPLCNWRWRSRLDLAFSFSGEYHAVCLLRFGGCFAFVPAVILARNRSEVYFYVYYVAKIIAGIFCEGSMHCLCLAYVVQISPKQFCT